MTEHTILVAFVVEHDTRERAMSALMERIGKGVSEPVNPSEPNRVDSWWVAEDDRLDESDTDSAIFVKPGHQQYAFHILQTFSASTESWNDPSKYLTGNRFKED